MIFVHVHVLFFFNFICEQIILISQIWNKYTDYFNYIPPFSVVFLNLTCPFFSTRHNQPTVLPVMADECTEWSDFTELLKRQCLFHDEGKYFNLFLDLYLTIRVKTDRYHSLK